MMIGKWGPVSKRQRRGRMNRRKWERRWKRMRISSVGWRIPKPAVNYAPILYCVTTFLNR